VWFNELCVALFSGSHSKAAWHRELATLGHLGGIFDKLDVVRSLRSLVPYCVKWSNVALNVSHEMIPKSQMLYAFNGNIVALCIADDKQVMLYCSVSDFVRRIQLSLVVKGYKKLVFCVRSASELH